MNQTSKKFLVGTQEVGTRPMSRSGRDARHSITKVNLIIEKFLLIFFISSCASALGLITFTLKKKKCFCFNFPYGWQNNYDGCIIKVVVLVTLLLVRLRLMLKREMLCLTIFSQQNFFS